ncbi:MAG: hypothetical protein ABIB46_03585 [bacterium]
MEQLITFVIIVIWIIITLKQNLEQKQKKDLIKKEKNVLQQQKQLDFPIEQQEQLDSPIEEKGFLEIFLEQKPEEVVSKQEYEKILQCLGEEKEKNKELIFMLEQMHQKQEIMQNKKKLFSKTEEKISVPFLNELKDYQKGFVMAEILLPKYKKFYR